MNVIDFLLEHGYDIVPSNKKGFEWFVPVPDDEYQDNMGDNTVLQNQGTHLTRQDVIELGQSEGLILSEIEFPG